MDRGSIGMAHAVMRGIMLDYPFRFHTLAFASAGTGSPHPRRVLIAEDDEEMRSLLVGELRRDGYDVREARDGAETAALLRDLMIRPNDAPEVVVMDVRMPSRTGLDVLADIRELGSQVPVILITAFGDREIHERAKGLDAIAVLDKPFDVDDLRTAILNSLPPAPAE